jgi:hypothetical protein
MSRPKKACGSEGGRWLRARSAARTQVLTAACNAGQLALANQDSRKQRS